MTSKQENDLIDGLFALQEKIHDIALDKGWWLARRAIVAAGITDEGRERAQCAVQAEAIALMHTELSEALEALRHGNPKDDKIPVFSGVEAELADVIIRILDFAEGYDMNVIEALFAKIDHNQTRPFLHGKGL
ncbi:MAG: hypothetical protein AB9869_17915 [Verrucomicrobiia bacterium]